VSIHDTLPSLIPSHATEEHHEIKSLVYEADKASSANDDYDTILSRAVGAFNEHAKEEEDGILAEMSSKLSADESDVSALSWMYLPPVTTPVDHRLPSTHMQPV
jgi:hypothetical protein